MKYNLTELVNSQIQAPAWFLGDIEKVAVVLEGVLCLETGKSGVWSKILLGWG